MTDATLPILAINTAAAAAERLSELGYNAESVTFSGTTMTLKGRLYDESHDFTLKVLETTDDVGTVTAVCEFISGQRETPLKFSAGSGDLVTALYLAIDDHL